VSNIEVLNGTYWKGKPRWSDLAEYAKSRLNGSGYDHGQLEEAQATADNCAEATGRLLQLLEDKGLISAKEAVTVIDGPYHHSDTEFRKGENDES